MSATEAKPEKKKLPFQLGEINPANLQQLRVLNVKTLPVRYSDKFYEDLIPKYTSEFLQYAFWNGFVVGAVCARLEDHKEAGPGAVKLYIMTINVLPAYRQRGIGMLSLHNSSVLKISSQ